ncbi:hypothetical protein SNE40_012721 [Patella caerulea]|uniref:C-type lectin domain-containing protein n=1 Tax=Patella caerulea TaxID=87958 RepID=A0AAN8JLI9_PATCE
MPTYLIQGYLWLISIFQIGHTVLIESRWRLYRNQAQLTTNFFQQTNTRFKFQCTADCSRLSECKSFSFDAVSKTCYFYNFIPLLTNPMTETNDLLKYYLKRRGNCPPTYTFIPTDRRCIFVSNTQKNFDDALTHCKTDGGTLTFVETGADRNFIKDNFDLEISYHLVGGTNRYGTNSSGLFYSWLNGTPVGGLWAPGEPDGGVDKCNAISPEHDYFIRDIGCANLYRFICEILV